MVATRTRIQNAIPSIEGGSMRLGFWTVILLAGLAVSCTNANRNVAETSPTPTQGIQSHTIRCASVEAQPQSDVCSAKSMAGQRSRVL